MQQASYGYCSPARERAKEKHNLQTAPPDRPHVHVRVTCAHYVIVAHVSNHVCVCVRYVIAAPRPLGDLPEGE